MAGLMVLVPLCCLLLAGCMTVEVYLPAGQAQTAEPVPTVNAKIAGRGCIAAIVTPKRAEIAAGQDGTSDWITGRVVAAVASIAGSIFGSDKGDGVLGGPSAVGGCDSLFEQAPEANPEPL